MSLISAGQMACLTASTCVEYSVGVPVLNLMTSVPAVHYNTLSTRDAITAHLPTGLEELTNPQTTFISVPASTAKVEYSTDYTDKVVRYTAIVALVPKETSTPTLTKLSPQDFQQTAIITPAPTITRQTVQSYYSGHPSYYMPISYIMTASEYANNFFRPNPKNRHSAKNGLNEVDIGIMKKINLQIAETIQWNMRGLKWSVEKVSGDRKEITRREDGESALGAVDTTSSPRAINQPKPDGLGPINPTRTLGRNSSGRRRKPSKHQNEKFPFWPAYFGHGPMVPGQGFNPESQGPAFPTTFLTVGRTRTAITEPTALPTPVTTLVPRSTRIYRPFPMSFGNGGFTPIRINTPVPPKDFLIRKPNTTPNLHARDDITDVSVAAQHDEDALKKYEIYRAPPRKNWLFRELPRILKEQFFGSSSYFPYKSWEEKRIKTKEIKQKAREERKKNEKEKKLKWALAKKQKQEERKVLEEEKLKAKEDKKKEKADQKKRVKEEKQMAKEQKKQEKQG